MLALHLLQNSLVYINTLMLQQVLAEKAWENRLNDGYHSPTNRQVLASGFERLHRDSHPYRLED
jgi:Tn3 transposase DDE domain